MGSIGEEELVQMVTDYIESSESSTPISVINSTSPSSCSHQATHLSLKEVLGKYTDDESEILEKILTYIERKRAMGCEEDNDHKRSVLMKLKTDGYEASLCKTSWVSSFTHRKGDYEYIDVMIVGKHGGKATRLIVDMDFRSQFEVARPTKPYKELIDSLPLIFVGTEEKLSKVISLVCSAAKRSLEENGLHIPPWRKFSYMQSKWLSKNCKKLSNLDLGIDRSEEQSSSACCASIFSRGVAPFIRPRDIFRDCK